MVPKCPQAERFRLYTPECTSVRLELYSCFEEAFFFIVLARDVRTHCNAFITCQKAKPSRKPKEPLELFECGATQLGEAVGMDIGILPWTGEHRYFLLVVDLFSHHVEAIPL